MAFEAPVSAPPALEDNLSAIFGLGSDTGAATARKSPRRVGPVLVAAILLLAGGGMFLTLGPWSGSGENDRGLASAPVRTTEPKRLAERPLPAPAPATNAQGAGEAVATAAGDQPSPPERATATRTPVLAENAAGRGTSVAARKTPPKPEETRTAAASRAAPLVSEQRQPARPAPTPARPTVPAAPAPPAVEEARTVVTPPPSREQIASAEVATADQPAASDDKADRAARRRARRQEERKVLDSFDAMRSLRRQ